MLAMLVMWKDLMNCLFSVFLKDYQNKIHIVGKKQPQVLYKGVRAL